MPTQPCFSARWGVDLFFLISGFIICVIALRGPGLVPAMTVREFAGRRFARIVPMMWLVILAYAALRFVSSGTFHQAEYLRAFFLIPTGLLEPNHLWTLRHEAIFYAVFAVAMLAGRRLWWLLAVWVALPFVYAALGLPEAATTAWGQFLRILANPVNVEFAAGFLIGCIWHRRTGGIELRLASPSILLAGATLAFFAAAWALALRTESLPHTLAAAALCAPLLFLGVHLRCPPGMLDRSFRLLGDASYSVYLLHPIFMSLAERAPWAWPSVAAQIGGTVALCIIGGIAAHIAIEKPLVAFARAKA